MEEQHVAPSGLIDSHSHLNSEKFSDHEIPELLERARNRGVTEVICIGMDLESSKRARDISGTYAEVFATAGVHPHEVGQFDDRDWAGIEALWEQPDIYGVGETGLDYYYDFAPRTRQRELFVRHLKASAACGKPVIIHVRDSFEDAFELIAKHPPAAGVMHCFTGDTKQCEHALSLRLHISFSGIITFASAESLRDASRVVPQDRVLVETDAPYLAPIPNRGKRNEPAFVADTAAALARARAESAVELAAATRRNAIELFTLPVSDAPGDTRDLSSPKDPDSRG